MCLYIVGTPNAAERWCTARLTTRSGITAPVARELSNWMYTVRKCPAYLSRYTVA